MEASDSRTPLTSFRVSFPSFSSANLEIRSDFDSGLPIRSISSGLPAGPGESFGILGETAGSWKRKAPGISQQPRGLAFGVETDRQAAVSVGKNAGVQRQSPVGDDQEIERTGSAGPLDLKWRHAQILAPPEYVGFPVRVDRELDRDLGALRTHGRGRGAPIVVDVVVDVGARPVSGGSRDRVAGH